MTQQLRLASLHIEGFKSFRNRVDIEFPESGGLHFLTGRNEAEPRLGANGAGKTSMWDAMFWCLYGCSVLGDRTSDLTTWGTKRPRVVVRLLSPMGEEFSIERQGSPERIYIDGQPGTQTQIDELTGLSRARFAQSVLFGQRAHMFYDLSIPARGELLDQVLDLSIWQAAADNASAECQALESAIKASQLKQAREEGRLAGLPDLKLLEGLCENWDKRRRETIEGLLADIEHQELLVAGLEKEYQAARKAYKKVDNRRLLELQKEMQEARSIRDKLVGSQSAHSSHEKLLRSNPKNCPTCLQPISAKFVKDKLHEYECQHVEIGMEIEKANALVEITREAYEASRLLVEKAESAMQEVVTRGERAAASLKAEQKSLERLAAQAQDLIDKDDNPYLAQIAQREKDAAAIAESLKAIAEEIDRHRGELALVEYWKQGFKKVRLFRIKRILLQLQVETANAASLLGIANWRIEFATEVENKSGGIKYGVQIRIFSPNAPDCVALPSGGEGQRLRLAIEMGFAALCQRLSGVRYNFEVWDEPSAFLSDEGLEDLLECLRYRSQVLEKAIWLTDHRTFAYNFDEVWTVVKPANGQGSFIEQTKES